MKIKPIFLIILINLSFLLYGQLDTLSKNETSMLNTNKVKVKVLYN